jgi:3'-5' exonuclease
MQIYLDIETIPTQSQAVRDMIRETLSPPGNIKKPESIAAWWAEQGETALADAIAKTALDPATGHICTIGWAVNDEPAEAVHAFKADDEADVLRAFFASIPAETWSAPVFIGHYITGFDLRFILCRAVVLGVPIPAQIPRDAKPWGKDTFDTMTAWAGSRGTIGLDRLCAALGIPGKDGFDGSKVGQAWAEGRHTEIIEYCKADVDRVRQVKRRFDAANF